MHWQPTFSDVLRHKPALERLLECLGACDLPLRATGTEVAAVLKMMKPEIACRKSCFLACGVHGMRPSVRVVE